MIHRMARAAVAAAALLMAPLAAQAGSLVTQPPEILGEDAAACTSGRSTAFLVHVVGLKDRAGSLVVELYPDTEEDFLASDKRLVREGKTFRRVRADVPTSGTAFLCLEAPGPGRYTMAVVHDRDGKRKFSAFADGVGFPGNPRLGLSKPPATRAMIVVEREGVTPVAIRLNYLRGLSVGPVRNPVDGTATARR